MNPQRRLTVGDTPLILMVDSRYDVATPYPGAVSAAAQIGPSATLLTYDGTLRVDYEESDFGQRPDPKGRAGPRALPNGQAALKCVYPAVMALDPTGIGRRRWITRWKSALNAFDLAFEGRLPASRN